MNCTCIWICVLYCIFCFGVPWNWNVVIYFVVTHCHCDFCNIAICSTCVYYDGFQVLQNKWYMYIKLLKKSELKLFMRPWFQGCNWNIIVRQSVNHKKIFEMIHKQQENYIKNHKTHHNQSKRPVTMLNAQMNTALLHRCGYTIEYNAKTRISCIWD